MFIDLHTHTLYGIDDGPSDMALSFNMLESAFSQGVSLVVMTPHCLLRDEESIKKFLSKREEKFKNILNESITYNKKIPELRLGAEVYLDNDISKFEGIERLCIQDTNIMLLELPTDTVSRRMVDWIYNITLLGIHPLLAHIERYNISDEIFAELIDLDVDFQINATIFETFKSRINLKKLLKKTNRLCVASDMHNNDNRSCNLLGAYKIATVKFPKIANKLFESNAINLLNEFSKM